MTLPDRLQVALRATYTLGQGGMVTRAWVRIDDRFAPLRGYPAFDRLVAAT